MIDQPTGSPSHPSSHYDQGYPLQPTHKPDRHDILRPNLAAALVASTGIVMGSIGPWATFLGLSLSGADGDGVITLVLGLISAVILAVYLYTGSRRLPWTLWVPVGIGIVSLLFSAYLLSRFFVGDKSAAEADLFGEAFDLQIGWGVWLLTLSSVVLCVSATVAAIQAHRQAVAAPFTGPPLTPAMQWAAFGSATVAALALVTVVIIRVVDSGEELETTADEAVQTSTTTTAAVSTETLPASATPCPPVQRSEEFASSATGSSLTSCPFAEEVRGQYLRQPERGTTVSIDAVSPVTGQTYAMTCSGNRIVTCTGGDNAVVYLY